MLMNRFAVSLPDLPIVCDEDVIAACDEIMRDIAVRPVAVDAGFLVKELLD